MNAPSRPVRYRLERNFRRKRERERLKNESKFSRKPADAKTAKPMQCRNSSCSSSHSPQRWGIQERSLTLDEPRKVKKRMAAMSNANANILSSLAPFTGLPSFVRG